MKKSGLADSPFFAQIEPKNEVSTPPSATHLFKKPKAAKNQVKQKKS
jgi:hypothetical protein